MREWDRRSFIFATGAAAAAVYAPAHGDEGQDPHAHNDFKALIDAERKRILEAMASDDIPGVAVCLIADGKLAWMEGFGVTDGNTQRRIAHDTIFSIQSTSKNFTTTAIMLAVQRGILDLDAPITSYLQDFTVRSRFEDRPEQKMTLRLLLSNRAGFTHEAPVGNNFDPEFESFEQHVRSIRQTWLRFPVGERYRYSNLGFDLAGYILEKRMGTPFADCLQKLIFEPLGMKDSTAATEVYARHANRALGHQRGYATVPLKTPLIASGGVYTSARDIAAYCLFHLNQGRVNSTTLLQEPLWNEMHAFPFGGDYSLGVIRKELRYGERNVRLLTHAGGGFGFGCVFQYCPAAGLAWVAMFNRPASAAYRFGEQLVDAVLTRRFGARTPRLSMENLASIALPADWLQKYAGRYVGRNASADLEVKDGALALQTRKSVSMIRFISPDELAVEDPEGNAVRYRHTPASALAPAHLECWIGESSLDYNDGAQDSPGLDKAAWARYVGTYRLQQWGKPADEVLVRRNNGHLYLNDIRLITEHEPGLFFTSDGEAVDFRSDVPTWRNVRMHRV